MASYSGFMLFSERGLVQASDKAYDLTWQGMDSLDGEKEFSGDFIAIEPLEGHSFFPVPLILKFFADNQNLKYSAEHNPEKIEKYKGRANIHYFGYSKDGALSSKSGLQVLDENGDITFSSNLLSMDILDSVYFDNIYNESEKNNGGYIAKIPVGDKKIAVSLTGIPFVLKRRDFEWYDAYSIAFKRENGYLIVYETKVAEKWMITNLFGWKMEYQYSLQFLILNLKGLDQM